MAQFNNPYKCPHMLVIFDTPTCIVEWKICSRVAPENCARRKEEKEAKLSGHTTMAAS